MLPLLSLEQTIEKTVREEWGRILAALITTLGDFQLAEDCLQDAVVAAMATWPDRGIPDSPAAWLITTAKRKAIDRLRKAQTFATKEAEISYLADLANLSERQDDEPQAIPDKRLEMIFTCCHPSLEEKTRVALTLRTLGGLTTDEIAAAFLDQPATMAQRLARGTKKIKAAGIPYVIPDAAVLPERISSVLSVIYLIFNEGYAASSGNELTRADLIDEAIRLGRIVSGLLPEHGEVSGLLALMLLHDSRRHARLNQDGSLVPLDAQQRGRWDRGKISEGTAILNAVLARQTPGPYLLQAAISAVHAESGSWADTDWPQIAALYDLLHAITPSDVVLINRAVAVSYGQSLDAALIMLDEAGRGGRLERYQPYHAARADFLSRAGDHAEAAKSFALAIALSDNAPERAFLEAKAATALRQ